MSELRPWLPLLAPPVGGEARLRAALTASNGRRSRPWQGAMLTFASASCAFLLLNLWLLRLPETPPDAVVHVMQRVAAKPVSKVNIVGGDAVEVASGSDQIRVFLVMSQ